MHEALSSIHVANRTYVDDFLDENVMRRVEALCRSLKPLPDTHRKDPKLLAVANEVASWQLERLKTNLNDMGFVIESASDATTISGSARVETVSWILSTSTYKFTGRFFLVDFSSPLSATEKVSGNYQYCEDGRVGFQRI